MAVLFNEKSPTTATMRLAVGVMLLSTYGLGCFPLIPFHLPYSSSIYSQSRMVIY